VIKKERKERRKEEELDWGLGDSIGLGLTKYLIIINFPP
jgi:hypothetical protein